MVNGGWSLRDIRPDDNEEQAALIRHVLAEFGADKPGFAWSDPQLDCLYDTYQAPGHRYLVVRDTGGQLLGGGGIAPFACQQPKTCELQKMYLLPAARGQGLGKTLLLQLLDYARAQGYRYCYLETFGPMVQAQGLYRSLGFDALSAPWGDSGHSSCDAWMVKVLTPTSG